MTMPFYVSPEQQMKDRADYARKGISQGRSVIVMQYEHGIMFAAENPSPALHKISEIYDRIAFAAAGRYNEFENLRVAGVRIADTRGYSYDRRDVTGRGLANTYAQVLGTIFSSVGEKPYEVEIVVAEVGEDADSDQVYRMTFHGSVGQERGFAVMGGSSEQISAYVKERYSAGQPLETALRLAVDALGQGGDAPRSLDASQLEVAVLDRTRSQVRKFKRVQGALLQRVLSAGQDRSDNAAEDSADSTGEAAKSEASETDSETTTAETDTAADSGQTAADSEVDEVISDAELDEALGEQGERRSDGSAPPESGESTGSEESGNSDD